MGCTSSKGESKFNAIDDSRHNRMRHDKKIQQEKGETPHTYVRRAEHPLLKQKEQEQRDQQTNGNAGGGD